MNFASPLVRGRLRRRYKRFLVDVELPDGVQITAHCPNTGAMTGCTEPGLEVWLSVSASTSRKYPHTLEVVCTSAGRVGVNTARANALVAEALAAGGIPELGGYDEVRREAAIPHDRGRFDFLLRGSGADCWLEVKSLTLWLGDGRGAFPDARSDRALRHVEALARRSRAGDRAVLLFCVQHTGVRFATPADEVHPEYGSALRAAAGDGVEVLAYGCRIEPDAVSLCQRLPVRL
ncbi:MAG: DNA/RNA nuclease SfsA [Pseudomonadales bacterium]